MKIRLNRNRHREGILGNILGGIFREKPKTARPIDLQGEQAKAIGGNIAMLPQLGQLGATLSQQQQNQVLEGMSRALPWWTGGVGQAGTLIKDLLSGIVPQGTQRELQRSTAAQALGLGIGGAPSMGNLFGGALARESTARQLQGLGALERWTQLGRALTPTVDITPMLVTPQLQLQNAFNEQQRRQRELDVKAAFSTGSRIADVAESIDAQIMQLATAFASSGGMKGLV